MRRSLIAFGSALDGQLGALKRVDVPKAIELGAFQPLHVACGAEHSMALLASDVDGSVALFGAGRVPGLVQSTRNFALLDTLSVDASVTGANAAALAAGRAHAFVRTADGRLFALGSNRRGELGLGQRNAVHGDACELRIDGGRVAHVACGQATSLVTLDNGKLYSCGRSLSNELGHGDPFDCAELQRVAAFDDARVLGAASAVHHSAVWTEDGALYTVGRNRSGECGVDDDRSRQDAPMLARAASATDGVVDASCGAQHTAAVTASGALLVCGDNSLGQLGCSDAGSGTSRHSLQRVPLCDSAGREYAAARVVCGTHYSLAITTCGRLFGWGTNNDLQLGLALPGVVPTPTLVECDALDGVRVESAAAGFSHTLLIAQKP